MKALFILSLIVALSSAYFIPNYSQINQTNATLRVSSVLAQNPAVVTQNNILQFCGTANQTMNVNSYNYQIGRSTTTWFSGTVNLPPQSLFAGANYCFYFNFNVPVIAKGQFWLNVTLTNPIGVVPHAAIQSTWTC